MSTVSCAFLTTIPPMRPAMPPMTARFSTESAPMEESFCTAFVAACSTLDSSSAARAAPTISSTRTMGFMADVVSEGWLHIDRYIRHMAHRTREQHDIADSSHETGRVTALEHA